MIRCDQILMDENLTHVNGIGINSTLFSVLSTQENLVRQ